MSRTNHLPMQCFPSMLSKWPTLKTCYNLPLLLSQWACQHWNIELLNDLTRALKTCPCQFNLLDLVHKLLPESPHFHVSVREEAKAQEILQKTSEENRRKLPPGLIVQSFVISTHLVRIWKWWLAREISMRRAFSQLTSLEHSQSLCGDFNANLNYFLEIFLGYWNCKL